MVIAIGVGTDGFRQILGVAEGEKEGRWSSRAFADATFRQAAMDV